MFPLVVSDLDGTLLNQNHQVSEQTRTVIRQLSGRGVKFIFATGRHYDDVEFIRSSLDVDMYLITSNGGRVHDPAGNVIIEHNIDDDLAKLLLALRKPYGAKIHTNVYQYNDWIVEREDEQLRRISGNSGFEYRLADLDGLQAGGIQKIFFVADDPKELLPLYQEAEALFGDKLSLTFSLPRFFEIMPGGVNKAAALESVLKLTEMRFTDVIAFGDGLNDAQMLSRVGKGLIMGEADDRLVKLLPNHEQIGYADNDAVAEYLKNLYTV